MRQRERERERMSGEGLELQLALGPAWAGPRGLGADPALKYLAKGALT